MKEVSNTTVSQCAEGTPDAAPEEVLERLQHIVDLVNFSEISSIRSVVTEIVRVINNPGSTVRELRDIILLDPPLAAKVLRTANSAYYSRTFSRVFCDIEQAIIWMGAEVIRELALNQKVCAIFERDEKIGDYSRKALCRHSIAVAMMARLIYRKEFGLRGENAYVAGLLHDIGIIAEDQFFQNDFQCILRDSLTRRIDLAGAELEYWGYDHAEIGEAICLSWRLPRELTSSVGGHHSPVSPRGAFFRITATLFAADYICRANGYIYGAAHTEDNKNLQLAINAIDVKPYALELIFRDVRREIEKMADKGLL